MKKFINIIVLMFIVLTPSFAEIKWDLGANANYEELLVIAQTNKHFDEIEIESEIHASVEHISDNGMSVGLVSVTRSSINENYDIDYSTRIVRLCLGYRF